MIKLDTCEQHDWISMYRKECPKGIDDCFQNVYSCNKCTAIDNGQVGGMSWNECFKECRRFLGDTV